MKMSNVTRVSMIVLAVGGAVLLGAVWGQAQSTFPVRFDEPQQAMVIPPAWATMGGLQFMPQDKPPVRCNAANVGFFYIQRDFQGTTPSPQVSAAPCVCVTCVDAVFCDGATGYADAAYYWLNTAGRACNQLWVPDPDLP